MRGGKNERDETVDLFRGQAALKRRHLDQGSRIDVAMLGPALQDPRANIALVPVPHHPGAARPPGDRAPLGSRVRDGLAATGPVAAEAPPAPGEPPTPVKRGNE